MDDIDAVEDEIKKIISDKKGEVEASQRKFDDANSKVTRANEYFNKSTTEFEKIKSHLNKLIGKIKDLENLKKNIESEDVNDNYAAAWFLNQQFNQSLIPLKAQLYDKAKLEEKLNESWLDVQQKKLTLRNQQQN